MARHAAPTERAAAPAAAADMRLDKWLWAARFFKTRALAAEDLEHGRILVNGQAAKPSRSIRPGDVLSLREPGWVRTVEVLGLSAQRGPAPVARLLYRDTPESLAAQAQAAELRRYGTEPAHGIEQGRPTKRDRRELTDWQRWSASIDDAAD